MPWSRLSLLKWVPEISPGVKAAGAYDWRPTTLVVPNVEMILGLNLPGTPRATSACRGTPLPYFIVISIVARLRAGKPWNCGSNSGRCKKFICSANHSVGLGGPLGLPLNRCQRLQCCRVIKLSTHLYVVSRLRMTGATTPIPRMGFWHAQGKTLTFTWLPYTCRFAKWCFWGFSSTTKILYTLFCHECCVFCPSHRTRHFVDLSYK